MKLVKGAILWEPTRNAWVVYYSYIAKPFQDANVEEDRFASWGMAMSAYRERDRTNRERMLRVRNRAEFAQRLLNH